MNIGESLTRNAQHFPDKRAIVDAHRSVTYARTARAHQSPGQLSAQARHRQRRFGRPFDRQPGRAFRSALRHRQDRRRRGSLRLQLERPRMRGDGGLLCAQSVFSGNTQRDRCPASAGRQAHGPLRKSDRRRQPRVTRTAAGIESAIEQSKPAEPEVDRGRQRSFPAHDHLRHHGISQSVQHRSPDLRAALPQLQHQQRHEPQRARVDGAAGALQRRPRLGDGDPLSWRHDHHSGKIRRRAFLANHRAGKDHLHHAGADACASACCAQST